MTFTDQTGENSLFDLNEIDFNLLILNQYGATILKQRKLFSRTTSPQTYSRKRKKGRNVEVETMV